jgi:hypothetical protein
VISFLFNSSADCSALKLNSEDGFPHSEICGSKVAHTSPQLIAACHVLHRLCMPRHPPIALTSRLRIHTTIDRPVLLAGRRYIGGLVCSDRSWLKITIEPTQLDNHCCFNMFERIGFHACAQSRLVQPMPSRHRFLEPIHNVKEGANPPNPRRPRAAAKGWSSYLERWWSLSGSNR